MVSNSNRIISIVVIICIIVIMCFARSLGFLRPAGPAWPSGSRRLLGYGQMGSTWEKGTPWHFWEDKSRLTGVPKQSLCQQKHDMCSDLISADPICPFPKEDLSHGPILTGFPPFS